MALCICIWFRPLKVGTVLAVCWYSPKILEISYIIKALYPIQRTPLKNYEQHREFAPKSYEQTPQAYNNVTRCYKSFRATPISFNEQAPKTKDERTPGLHQRAKTKSEQQNTLPRHTASYRYHHTNAHSKSEQPNSRMLSMCKSKRKTILKMDLTRKK